MLSSLSPKLQARLAEEWELWLRVARNMNPEAGEGPSTQASPPSDASAKATGITRRDWRMIMQLGHRFPKDAPG